MPYLNVKLCAPESAGAPEKIAALLTDLTVEVLRKKRELTAVAVEHVGRNHWFIGGTPMASQQTATFYLEIKVTEGTNTKDEKAIYIQKVFAAIESVLGGLNPASYIVIHEVRADAWGYQGATQEYRYVSGKRL
jgi:4-oxalocrotonate tautomerase